MKVHVSVIDSRTGIYQCGMIDEPVMKGVEVKNALAHFGVQYELLTEKKESEFGFIAKVEGTSKLISVIIL